MIKTIIFGIMTVVSVFTQPVLVNMTKDTFDSDLAFFEYIDGTLDSTVLVR